MNSLRHVLGALVLLALAGHAWAQGLGPFEGTVAVAPTEALEQQGVFTATVRLGGGFDFDPELDWGDGSSDTVDRFVTGDQVFTHSYAAAGDYAVQLTGNTGLGSGTLLDEALVTVWSIPSLSVAPTSATVGEVVRAALGEVSPGFSLDWGDGTVIPAADGSFEHSYAGSGVFAIRVLDPNGLEVPGVIEVVTVDTLPATLSVDPAGAEVGETVTASVAGMAGSPLTLAWGDGRSASVLADGSFEHSYAKPGIYEVSLSDDAAATLAVEVVTVSAGGALTADPLSAEVGETVTFMADRLAPGYAYRLDFGDGQSEAGMASGAGELAFSHSYGGIGAFTVELVLTEGGQETLVDMAVVSVALPPAGETIGFEQLDADPLAGVITARVDLDNLVPGLSYALIPSGGAFAYIPFTATGASESFEVALTREGIYTLELAVELPGGRETRALEVVTPSWPRGFETIEPAGDPPFLAGDEVVFDLDGLVPGYSYRFVYGNGFEERFLATAETETLAVFYQAGSYTVELYAVYPGGIPAERELRDSRTLSVGAPSGTLALVGGPPIPFGVPVTLTAGDLVPGATYRIGFGDGQSEIFTAPAGGSHPARHAFAASQSVDLYLLTNGTERLMDRLEVGGFYFTGKLAFTYENFYADGGVTIHASELAPRFRYGVEVGGASVGEVTADEEGKLQLRVSPPGGGSQRVVLKLLLDEDSIIPAVYGDMKPPPQTLTFHGTDGYRVRVTSLTETFVYPDSLNDFSGEGMLENLVIGGRLQDPIPFSFEGLEIYLSGRARAGEAHMKATHTVQLPYAVQGLELVLNTVILRGGFSSTPKLAGTGRLPGGATFDFDDVWMPFPSASGGFVIFADTNFADTPLGASGWRISPRNGGTGRVVVDLATNNRYNLNYPGRGDAISQAYAGWRRVGAAPPVDPAGTAWVGLLYPGPAVRQGSGVSLYEAFAPVAWTAAGFQTTVLEELGDENGQLSYQGWTFEDVTPLEVSIVNSQVVHFTQSTGRVNIPFFGKDVLVRLSPERWNPFTSDQTRSIRISTLGPVAVSYGDTAVVAGQGVFQYVNGVFGFKFPSALWALDGDLASDPSTVDSSSGDALLNGLPDVGSYDDALQQQYSDAVTTAETTLNLFKLQVLLKDLSIWPNGYVSLGGSRWATLAKVPELDMFGFPYLGAGAEVGVKYETSGVYQGDYAIGLRGGIALGDLLETEAAPSWYYHKDGKERRWEFEGFSVSYGGLEGSPVSFSVVAGGTIDLDSDDLEFHGGGSLTVEKKLNIQVAGVFGKWQDTSYWLVYAATDLALAQKPITIKVNGVDVLSFYVFRGGVGQHLRLTTEGGEDDACRVDDANIPGGVLPSVIVNARRCLDPNIEVNLLAGTLVGSPSKEPDLYGMIWHLDANMVLNIGAGGNAVISGRGWTMKSLDDGYRADSAPSLAARLSIDDSAITGTLCAGPQQTVLGDLDCSGLEPLRISAAGLTVVEMEGVAELRASWSDSEYFFALGRVTDPFYGYVIPQYVSGYLVAGYIKHAGIIDPKIPLPAAGLWAGAEVGYAWSYYKSGELKAPVIGTHICDYSVSAYASFGYGGAFGITLVPEIYLSASVTVQGSASAHASGCGIGGGLGASIRATGTISGPDPLQFGGNMRVSISLPVVPDINVTVGGVAIRIPT